MRNRPQRQRSAFSVLRAVSAHRETAERNVCIVLAKSGLSFKVSYE